MVLLCVSALSLISPLHWGDYSLCEAVVHIFQHMHINSVHAVKILKIVHYIDNAHQVSEWKLILMSHMHAFD